MVVESRRERTPKCRMILPGKSRATEEPTAIRQYHTKSTTTIYTGLQHTLHSSFCIFKPVAIDTSKHSQEILSVYPLGSYLDRSGR